MASVLRSVKQTPVNGAFFVNLGDIRANVVQNIGASAEAPLLSSATWVLSNSTVNSSLAVAGRAFLRDMGVNLVSSGRTFRKVQLMVSTGVVYGGAGTSAGTDGVGGSDVSPINYLTGYIELPGASSSTVGTLCTPVARLG